MSRLVYPSWSILLMCNFINLIHSFVWYHLRLVVSLQIQSNQRELTLGLIVFYHFLNHGYVIKWQAEYSSGFFPEFSSVCECVIAIKTIVIKCNVLTASPRYVPGFFCQSNGSFILAISFLPTSGQVSLIRSFVWYHLRLVVSLQIQSNQRRLTLGLIVFYHFLPPSLPASPFSLQVP